LLQEAEAGGLPNSIIQAQIPKHPDWLKDKSRRLGFGVADRAGSVD